MAKNWLVSEAAHAVHDGDKSAIRNIGARFPLALALFCRLNDAGIEFADAIPQYITVRKLESALKDGVEAYDDSDANDAEDEVVEEEVAPKKKEKPAPAKEEKKRGRKPVVEEDDDEDDDEEEEIPAPKKAAKKAKKEEKPVKKAKKKVVEEDEDDDDAFDFDLDDDDE